jgi:hypothetical protein
MMAVERYLRSNPRAETEFPATGAKVDTLMASSPHYRDLFGSSLVNVPDAQRLAIATACRLRGSSKN